MTHQVAGYHPTRWLLDDPCISLRAHAASGASAAAVARACGMWEYSEVRRIASMWEYSEVRSK